MPNSTLPTSNNSKPKKNLWMVFMFPILVLGIGFGLYFVQFHGAGLSKVSQEWGSYGSYLTSFVNLSNLCVAIYFSYLVYQYNTQKDSDAKQRETEFREFQKLAQNPVLSFRTKIDREKGEQWYVVNVGNGPALNLQVCYKSMKSDEWIPPLVKCYSLSKGDEIILEKLYLL
jgi:hypothetical protein